MKSENKTMRIIFVGTNNKVGKQPLCSSTRSGQVIDKLITNIQFECIKTNLYDTSEVPGKRGEKAILALDWYNRINPKATDIIILLGKEVANNFKVIRAWQEPLELQHPGRVVRGFVKEHNYLEDFLKLINQK